MFNQKLIGLAIVVGLLVIFFLVAKSLLWSLVWLILAIVFFGVGLALIEENRAKKKMRRR